MGLTRVDLRHLLEDLRDAYPGALEETFLVEVVANSLDSGASHIHCLTDPAERTFTVIDDGKGMSRRELGRYHDLAATSKRRGQGIGFAGVGIKLALLAAEEVITESRTTRVHVATTWHLASRYRAPWKWIDVGERVETTGTAVVLRLSNPLSPLLDPGYVESVLHEHYRPLFDPDLSEFLAASYPSGIRFTVNGRSLPELPVDESRVAVRIRLKGKRKPSGVGYLIRSEDPLPEPERGVAVSTRGKVIKHGWDWLGLSPAMGKRVGGLIEIPTLAECLMLNKSDFIRTGPYGATYLTYRKAAQEIVSEQLSTWGETDAEPPRRKRRTRSLERDLEGVLLGLTKDYPLLSALIERRRGGQRRIPLGEGGKGMTPGGAPGTTLLTQAPGGTTPEAGEPTSPESPPPETPPSSKEPGKEEAAGTITSETALPSRGRSRTPGRYGLHIQFETRPDDHELGRLVESTVLVNDAHPAYLRATASRSEGYHLALTVAMALAPLAVEAEKTHAFITDFMARWGKAAERSGSKRR